MKFKLQNSGFTLLEIMISLLILAILGMIITSGLHLSVNAQQHFVIKNQNLTEAQLAMMIIESDVRQIVDRSIIDESGKKRSAIELSESQMELTHAGYINPFNIAQRSTLQRVGYKVEDNHLIRITWDSLDRSPSTKVIVQKLLEGVTSFHLKLISSPKNQNVSIVNNDDKNNQIIAKAMGVQIEMEIIGLGYIKRVIPLAMNIILRDRNVKQ